MQQNKLKTYEKKWGKYFESHSETWPAFVMRTFMIYIVGILEHSGGITQYRSSLLDLKGEINWYGLSGIVCAMNLIREDEVWIKDNRSFVIYRVLEDLYEKITSSSDELTYEELKEVLPVITPCRRYVYVESKEPIIGWWCYEFTDKYHKLEALMMAENEYPANGNEACWVEIDYYLEYKGNKYILDCRGPYDD